jgi:hypothetical protein
VSDADNRRNPTGTHWWTIVLVTITTLLLGIARPEGHLTLVDKEFTLAIFQVAGTMVALALPAAQLANSFVVKLEEVAEFVMADDGHDDIKESFITGEIQTLRTNVTPALRASRYSLAAFVCSALAMVAPSRDLISDGGVISSIQMLLASLSLSLLVAAACWFFPSIRYAFSLNALDRLHKMVQSVTKAPPVDPGKEVPKVELPQNA